MRQSIRAISRVSRRNKLRFHVLTRSVNRATTAAPCGAATPDNLGGRQPPCLASSSSPSYCACRSVVPLIGLATLRRALGGETPPFDSIRVRLFGTLFDNVGRRGNGGGEEMPHCPVRTRSGIQSRRRQVSREPDDCPRRWLPWCPKWHRPRTEKSDLGGTWRNPGSLYSSNV